MPLFYGSPAEGLAYLEAAAGDDWFAAAVYADAVKRGEAGDEDDGTA
jgi:hypothetical protein